MTALRTTRIDFNKSFFVHACHKFLLAINSSPVILDVLFGEFYCLFFSPVKDSG